MVDTLDRDRQGPLFSDRDEAFFRQVPFVKLEMLVGAFQHVLQIEPDDTGILGVLIKS